MFAFRGDVLMPCDVAHGVALPQRLAKGHKGGVLRLLEAPTFQPLELNADRVVVAGIAPPVVGTAACQARRPTSTNCHSTPVRVMKKCVDTSRPRICWK